MLTSGANTLESQDKEEILKLNDEMNDLLEEFENGIIKKQRMLELWDEELTKKELSPKEYLERLKLINSNDQDEDQDSLIEEYENE